MYIYIYIYFFFFLKLVFKANEMPRVREKQESNRTKYIDTESCSADCCRRRNKSFTTKTRRPPQAAEHLDVLRV